MNINPLEDRIVVKIREAKEKSEGGIYYPEQSKERPHEGIVVAVGTGRVFENGTVGNMTVSIGDVVLIAKYAGNDVEIDGDKYTIMREAEVLATIGKEL